MTDTSSNGKANARVRRVLLHLPDAVEDRGGWIAGCPGCGGYSLHVVEAIEDCGARVFCDNGCGMDDPEELVGRIGLTLADLKGPGRPKPPPAQPGQPLTREQMAEFNRNGGQFPEPEDEPELEALAPVSLGTLLEDNPAMRPAVVEGICREGEIVNVIAKPKEGKSWFTYGLAHSVAAGLDWLDCFRCTQGRVLLIDNELHPQTLARRIPDVAEAMRLKPEEYRDRFDVLSLRGRLRSVQAMGGFFRDLERGEYRLIIIDALYRMIAGSNENDNAAMAGVYNTLDMFASETGAAFVLIHHASKGGQAEKDITDVGSGAGSQSRAADAHLILRPHEVDSCAVLDAAVRSFPPVAPVVLKWAYPLWSPIEGLDPSQLKSRGTKAEQRQRESDQNGMRDIANALRENGPSSKRALRRFTGMGPERLDRLLGMLEHEGSVRWQAVEAAGTASQEYSLVE